jgi:hypothetical protein
MDIPADRQHWYTHLCRFGGKNATVLAHTDHSGAYTIEVFRADSDEGALLSTIGLMDIDQSPNPSSPVFSEILMDSRGRDEKLGSVLATIAFHVMKHKWRLAPGVLFERAIDLYFPQHALPHAMLVAPFQWKTGMTRVQLATKTIYPLVAAPISEAERQFATENSPRALEQAWESQRVDVLDWSRASAV